MNEPNAQITVEVAYALPEEQRSAGRRPHGARGPERVPDRTQHQGRRLV